MIKMISSLFLLVAIFTSAWAEPLSLTVQAESALLINAETGRVLFEKNANVPQYPASITKIATALFALKLKGQALEEKVSASADSVASVTEEAKRRSNYTLPSWWLVPGTAHAGIKKGEILSFKELLYAMMITSAGDAANVIAEHAGGEIPVFIKGMNEYVSGLGCRDTHFENPHGLFHPEQKTTAHDMALIMREALKEPFFAK